MKSKIALGAGLLLIGILISCAGGGHPFPTTPKFLLAVDGCPTAPCPVVANVNVFPINSTTGALGTAVSSSPFNLGLADPMVVEVHPNGKWFYVADGSDGSIHQWSVDESTGVPTDIVAKMVNESGSFYEPADDGPGASPTHVITVTPGGKYLYTANNDATVGAYSIGSNGALTHISDLNVSDCSTGDPSAGVPPVVGFPGDTGAVTSTDNFVWVTDTCGDNSYNDGSGQGTNGNGGPWYVYTMKIGSNGSLTKTSTVALTGAYSWLWSIQINPAANLLYVGDEGGTAQVYGYKVASDGSLTQLTLGTSTSQYQDNSSSDCRFLEHSPDGKFLYWTDDDDRVHTFSEDTTTGAIAELTPPASPYQIQSNGTTTYIGGEGQIVVDQTGKFVYAAEVYHNVTATTGGVLTFTRDSTTGALTMVGTTDTSTTADKAVALGIVR